MHDLATQEIPNGGCKRLSLHIGGGRELLALARGKEGWAVRVKQIDPVDHNVAATVLVVASLLDASAEEWRKGVEARDGKFTG